ncbi:MAG TPA: glycosyltransferase family 2 protein [Polyangia bacterium]|nr:glycosyltransferase family 2 protein [Polyangia bacterium]
MAKAQPIPAPETARLTFSPTSAVSNARAHSQFVRCPSCQADASTYLFHRAGVRFVRCTSCGAVYVNPTRPHPLNDFDIARGRPFSNPRDQELTVSDFGQLLDALSADVQRMTERPLTRVLLLGRHLREFADLPQARRVGLAVAELDDPTFERLATASEVDWAAPLLARAPEVVILHELLEACSDPGTVVERLLRALPPKTLFAVTYTNTDSLPARMMRRYWPSFLDYKASYLSTGNLTALMSRLGLVLKRQYPLPVTRTAQYIAEIGDRIVPKLGLGRVVRATPLRDLALPVRAGNRVALFGRASAGGEEAREKLSIVLPIFNEARYAARVIDTVLGKPLRIDREVIIVESNSTDGTREIVRRYEGRPGVRVLLEDRPRGKGHAVRTGLAHVTGTIVLIQDADFEYDVDDYDALLEPILQNRATFVLGSRSLGLDDWKVRRYDATPVRGWALNFAQVVFAKTYNALYQQRVTDVNTMFKVFRARCLDGLDLRSNGFELDIELACQLARNGHSPMEVPVNYAARGFAEGKKIRFWRDAIPSYAALFMHRFSQGHV